MLSDPITQHEQPTVEVILRFGDHYVAGARLPSQVQQIVSELQCINTHLQLFAVNGSLIGHDVTCLSHGDILDMCKATVVKAGGHHLKLKLLVTRNL